MSLLFKERVLYTMADYLVVAYTEYTYQGQAYLHYSNIWKQKIPRPLGNVMF